MADLWSMLPSDLLWTIANRLLTIHAIDDYIRFRAVCVSWRSAATTDPPPQGPWLIYHDAYTEDRLFVRLSDTKVFNFHLPEIRKTRILASSDGCWFVLIHDTPNICLFNPYTRVQIALPPLTTLPGVLEYREHAPRGQEYTIQSYGPEPTYLENSRFVRDHFVDNVVMFPEHSLRGGDGMLVAMMSRSDLFLASVGDDKWTHAARNFGCSDILSYQGRFYVVNEYRGLAILDIGAPETVVETIIVGAEYPGCPHYLVEMAGNLLVVCRCDGHRRCDGRRRCLADRRVHYTERFEVFRVDGLGEEEPKLTKLDSLGDWTLFLGMNRSVSFDTKNHPSMRSNHIIFTHHRFMNFTKENGFTSHCRDDFRTFCLDDGH